MKQILPILSISGSDSTGGAGIQGDIKTIVALGAYPVSVVTTIAVQNLGGLLSINDIPAEVVDSQLKSVLDDITPKAVKIGLLGSSKSAESVLNYLSKMQNIVYAPGLESAYGETLYSDGKLNGNCLSILNSTRVLVLKVSDAESMLNKKIASNEEILQCARCLQKLGPKNVLIFGGHSSPGFLTSVLLLEDNSVDYHTLNDSDNWKAHGLGAALSAAVATFLAKEFDVKSAVKYAHEYVRSMLLYSVELRDGFIAKLLHRSSTLKISDRKVEIYNSFMQLVATYHKSKRDVVFYANKLCVSERYLSQITTYIAGKSPKRLIHDYIIKEVEREIISTRKSIQEISYMFGFESQAQFTKFFRSQKGISPLALRTKNN